MKAAKWPLGLILAECCIYAWESQPYLSPVAIQVHQVVEAVGFHRSHGRGVSPAAEVPGKADDAHGVAPSLQASSLGPHSPQTKGLSHFLEKE